MTFFLDLAAILYFIFLFPVPLFWLLFHARPSFWRHFGYGAYLLVLAGYLAMMSVTFGTLSTFLTYRSAPDPAWMLAGLALVVFGFAVEVRAATDLSLQLMIGIPHVAKCERSLRTSGLYGFVRHPLYLAYMLMALGLAVATGMTALWFLFFWSVAGLLLVISREERELTKCFGETYRRYAKRTAMLIPRIW